MPSATATDLRGSTAVGSGGGPAIVFSPGSGTIKYDPKTHTYKTLMYGGGVNKSWAGNDPTKQAYNERFLEAQMNAVKETMPGHS